VAAQLAATVAGYEAAIDQGLLGQALRVACDLAVFGNGYVQRKKLWATQDGRSSHGGVEIAKDVGAPALALRAVFAGKVTRVLASNGRAGGPRKSSRRTQARQGEDAARTD